MTTFSDALQHLNRRENKDPNAFIDTLRCNDWLEVTDDGISVVADQKLQLVLSRLSFDDVVQLSEAAQSARVKSICTKLLQEHPAYLVEDRLRALRKGYSKQVINSVHTALLSLDDVESVEYAALQKLFMERIKSELNAMTTDELTEIKVKGYDIWPPQEVDIVLSGRRNDVPTEVESWRFQAD